LVEELVAHEQITQDIADYIIELSLEIGGEDGVDYPEFLEI